MKRPIVWAWVGAAVALVLAALSFDPRLFTGGDNATYYALAEALATGRGYVDLIAPGHPPHAVYPPGYPAFLVPFYWLFSGSIVGIKAASLVAGAVVLWATWRVARRDPAVPAWAAAAAVGLVGLYPVFLDYAHWVLSEMTYLAVTLLAIGAFLGAEGYPAGPAGDDGEGSEADGWTGSWTIGLGLALASFLVRTAGLALLLAALLHALLKRRWRRAGAAAGVTAVGVVPWLLWTSAHAPATGSYLEQLLASNRHDPQSPPISMSEFLQRIGENLAH
ncbi:MAG: glycosyltransferase 87 family protein, partial [Gemmatimonadota bacterium]|nr:glycosyltransferase 87 family protein [Gemmatimonadota bacterium]